MSDDDLTPAQIVAMEYEGYLHSPHLDPAWIAGWHSAINHATHALAKQRVAPASSDRAARSIKVFAELGTAWIERGGDHLFIEPAEIPAVVAALLALSDAFEDAAA